MQDLWRLSAAELAALIRSKKIPARDAAIAALARLDSANPKINAVIDHRPEEVLAQAQPDGGKSAEMVLLRLITERGRPLSGHAASVPSARVLLHPGRVRCGIRGGCVHGHRRQGS